MEQTLWQAIQRLAPLAPRFVSVTYGADGSTRERTHQVVIARAARDAADAGAASDLRRYDRGQILDIARGYWHAGVRHIVALRGDPPQSSEGYRPHPGGFPYAVDLVRGLKSVADFEISVAAYPEGHPEAPSAGRSIWTISRPSSMPALIAPSRSSFSTPRYSCAFRDRCAAAGITRQPGTGHSADHALPADAALCRRAVARSVPDWLCQRFEGLEEDADTRRMIAAAVAIAQVEQLAREGVEEFHFYTLNRVELTYAICHALGVRAAAERRARPVRSSRP